MFFQYTDIAVFYFSLLMVGDGVLQVFDIDIFVAANKRRGVLGIGVDDG
jgi:hypothetical protein